MLTDEQINDARETARKTYRHSQAQIRGQQLTASDDHEWHFARAIESAACADRDKRIAELEERNRDLYEDVKRFKEHALNEKAARLELERQLEEARNQALEDAAVECDKRAHAGDAGALMAARAIRALKGSKE